VGQKWKYKIVTSLFPRELSRDQPLFQAKLLLLAALAGTSRAEMGRAGSLVDW